jgi:hypothetical protein
MEPIDTENDEYLLWDANGEGVRIAVKHGHLSSIEKTGNEITLHEAFACHSQAMRVSVETSGTIPEVWTRLREAEANLPRPRGLLSRLFRKRTKEM